MTRRIMPTAAAGLVLGTALSLLAAVGAAEAAPSGTSGYATTVQAKSNVRSGPFLAAQIHGTTTKVTAASIDCWLDGDTVTAGGYTTNVWYRGTVAGYNRNNAWVWGGNVNVGADPAPGIPGC
ncbi:hypothetical protein [Streptomyces sp. A0592]|uniref:hypothetical protein n=1 Tax=Streptomyces sp. A0592 TaxID=2563099 RepID=UPI00109EACDC|nr:hypothetical protein [Streptomyces sp. A0592]THA76806.1 hypothetical protein E6U81_34935 [Streptomyces sp. A0592]